MIWCVEDDAAIRDIEVYALQSVGMEARGYARGDDFWQALQDEQPELVVLDVMLPGLDGVELLRRIRASEKFKELPVIMATAKGAEYDKIQSLDIGADDYVVKPFGVMELVSRVKAVGRRYKAGGSSDVLTLKGVVLKLNEHIVEVDAKRVELTYKEFELLKLFMYHPGVAYTREQLFSIVWGLGYAEETRTVDMHIRTLRKKLGSYAGLIETVRNIGYRMEK
jgi:two-component system alkaline phosphatase synthesis response regulator PhoP